jgi:transposase
MRPSPERVSQLLTGVLSGDVKYARAAEELNLSARHIRRLVARFEKGGLSAIQHRAIGRPRPGKPSELKDRVISIVRDNYHDFGPSLAAEKLKELHGINVSREWLRQAMLEAGLWKGSPAKRRRMHQLREPSPRRGMLIQIDGSPHAWFEDRAEKCSLLVFIDDATSELMHLQFVRVESTLAYMACLRQYLQKHGKPLALYSDRHSIFYNSRANLDRTDGLTQFGLVLHNLNISIICAKSPQAKGRVERANRTLQDRLVKELRLAGISNMEEGNIFLQCYMTKHNARFAREPLDPLDAHTPLSDTDRIDKLIRYEVSRRLTASLVVHNNKVMFILEDTPLARKVAGSYVLVCEYPNGEVEIEFDGIPLPYRTFDKLRRVRQPEVVDSKRLGAALEFARMIQEANPHVTKRNNDAPVRIGGVKSVFDLGALEPRSVPAITKTHPDSVLRTVSKQRSFSYKGVRFVLDETELTRCLIGQSVEIKENPDGDFDVLYEGSALPYSWPSALSLVTASRASGDPHMRR